MADISIWQKTGHFYFALTAESSEPLINLLDKRPDNRDRRDFELESCGYFNPSTTYKSDSVRE
jgi:hypothetical protein